MNSSRLPVDIRFCTFKSRLLRIGKRPKRGHYRKIGFRPRKGQNPVKRKILLRRFRRRRGISGYATCLYGRRRGVPGNHLAGRFSKRQGLSEKTGEDGRKNPKGDDFGTCEVRLRINPNFSRINPNWARNWVTFFHQPQIQIGIIFIF